MIELLVIGATLTLAAWARSAEAHRKSAASRALDQYSRSRGLVFAPAPAFPRGASPKVVGAKDDVRFDIELYRLGGELRTRVSAATQRGRAPALSILQRGAFALRGGSELRLGDEALERAYVLREGTLEDAELLRAAAPALLLLAERRSGVWLASGASTVAVSWRGSESDPLVLDAARDAAIRVAAWHRSESPYR